MTDNDKRRFAEIMYGVAENFGGSTTREGLALRFNALIHLDIDQVAAAATLIIKTRVATFPAMPTVKEFLDAAQKVSGYITNTKSRAEIQADEVLLLLRQRGHGTCCRELRDPISKRLMILRWTDNWWKSVQEEDLKWWRKEFIEAYQAYSEQSEVEGFSLPCSAPQNLIELTKGIGHAL